MRHEHACEGEHKGSPLRVHPSIVHHSSFIVQNSFPFILTEFAFNSYKSSIMRSMR